MKIGLQFTHVQPSVDACREWFDWFDARKIPAAIIQIESAYFVFRKGAVLQRREDGSIKSIPIIGTPIKDTAYKVIEECNGFSANPGKRELT